MTLPSTFDIQGQSLSFPIDVRRARMGNAVYTVPAERLVDVVPDGPFELAVDDFGNGTVVLGFVDYIDNDLGDYDEVLFSVMARAKASGDEGTYIWRLPVNQGFTCEAGQRMLGLPKTVESITIDDLDGATECRLTVDGELVLRQRIPTMADVPGVAMEGPTVCLTEIDGVAYRADSDPVGDLRMQFDATGYELELGVHPWAKELASFGIEQMAPSAITWCDPWACHFLEPTPI